MRGVSRLAKGCIYWQGSYHLPDELFLPTLSNILANGVEGCGPFAFTLVDGL